MSRPPDHVRRTWKWRVGWAFLIGVAAGAVGIQLLALWIWP